MGRASRGKAHRQRVLGADNRGNRWRKIIAGNECLALLVRDLRVQEHFRHWVRAMDQLQRDGPPDWITSDTPIPRVIAVIERGEIDYLADVLRRMGVPWRWCAEVLIRVSFPTMLHNTEHPDDLHAVHGTYDLRSAPRGGKTPRHREDVAEWVRWWYRRKIKHPPDELHDLVAEYAARENRVTEAHSVVQNGIERAELLLNVGLRPAGLAALT